MDFGGFVVEGSRPPSVQSNHRPSSGINKHGYHTIAYQSSVDETLFSSHHPSSIHKPVLAFKAPWEYPKPKHVGNTFVNSKMKDDKTKSEKKQKGRPLFWAPDSGTVLHSYKKKDNKNVATSSVNQFWNSRDHFRHLKHTPTFVDESLFGSRLEEPSFEAPWGEKYKAGHSHKTKFNLWDSRGSSNSNSNFSSNKGLRLNIRHMKYSNGAERPKSALGISRDKTTQSPVRSKAVPVWKP